MENITVKHPVLRFVFCLTTFLFFLAIGIGLYYSLATQHRLPRLNSAYLPEINSLLEQGEYKTAIPELEMATELDFAALPDLHSQLGNAFKKTGQLDKAIHHYQEVIRLKPDSATAHYNLASTLQHSKRLSEAAAHYQLALTHRPDHIKTLGNLGGVLYRMGRVDQAARHYEAAIEIDPDSVEAQNNLAWLLATCHDQRMRNGARAVELAERAAAATKHQDFTVLDTLSAAYAEAGDFERAVATQTKAVSLSPLQVQREMEQRLELYRLQRPYHDAPPSVSE